MKDAGVGLESLLGGEVARDVGVNLERHRAGGRV